MMNTLDQLIIQLQKAQSLLALKNQEVTRQLRHSFDPDEAKKQIQNFVATCPDLASHILLNERTRLERCVIQEMERYYRVQMHHQKDLENVLMNVADYKGVLIWFCTTYGVEYNTFYEESIYNPAIEENNLSQDDPC